MDHIGIDVHQKYSEICVVSEAGSVLRQARIPTTRTSLERWFGGLEPARVVIEAGGSTNWVSRVLDELGHEVTVVDPRRVRLIAESTMKTDAIDAEVLARLPPPTHLHPRSQSHFRDVSDVGGACWLSCPEGSESARPAGLGMGRHEAIGSSFAASRRTFAVATLRSTRGGGSGSVEADQVG